MDYLSQLQSADSVQNTESFGMPHAGYQDRARAAHCVVCCMMTVR